ncbi:MAG: F0F1 ATP synthase subunit A, partial [Micrococcus sp.]|nr:F0F1 ATP synthase subunit A [Micrococcus sp.]
RHHGIKYFKLAVVPKGVPSWILPLLVPLEIISNFIVRPLTHSLRLMATMLAGHMIIMLAGSGADYLITQTDSIFNAGLGIMVIIGSVALYFLELLIMVLQAFVFTLLTSLYIQGAIAAND